MKVLLINPLTIDKRMIAITPNIGLGYIATSLRKNGFKVEIWDGVKKGMSKKKLEERLKILDYDVAGFQVYTCGVKETQECLKTVKSLSPEIITIIGGAHPSCDPEGVMIDLKEADFAFRGEAEIGLIQLLKKLNGENVDYQLEDVHNLIWRENGKVHYNSLRPIEDLDSLGTPSWDLINPNDYPNAPIGTAAKYFPISTISITRGCPYPCTFCAGNIIMGRKVRGRSPKSVLDEMQLLYDDYGVREFQIIDDTFTSKRDLAVGICKEIIEKGLKVSLSFPIGVRLNTLDEELLKLLEEAGTYSLGLGIESGSEKILKMTKKMLTIEEIREKVNLIHRVTKIRITGFFIIGFPGEEKEDILESIKLSKELPLNRAQFGIFFPVPGTEMYEELKRKGKLDKVDLNNLFVHEIFCVPDKMTLGQLKRLRLRAFLEFYCRPRILFGLLSEIHSWEHLNFILKRIRRVFF